jgi:hypothetical protein
MLVALTGASGLIGSGVALYLTQKNFTTIKILHETLGDNTIVWKPKGGDWDTTFSDGVEGIVHLAGENIASGKWTKEKKEAIKRSRIEGTKKLCSNILNLPKPPKVLVCASAIGFYGNRGEEILNEGSSRGHNFLSDVCVGWEEATKDVSDAGIRVVNLRFGVVLSQLGGALAKMLTPFRLGMGGRLGSGRQYMSWVAIDDVTGAIHHSLVQDSLSGPVNVTAPNPVTNREFTNILGRLLKRPTVMPMPAFAAKLAFGEMGEELLLSSARVEPKKLLDSGYHFQYPRLEHALDHILHQT